MDRWWGKFIKDKDPAMERFKTAFNQEMLDLFIPMMKDMLKAMIRIGKRYEMPILFTNLFLSRTDTLIEFLQEQGVPMFLPSVAPKIMSLMWQYAQYRQKLGTS